MSVIGIDLGTTFLSVAYSRNGKITVIDDDQGKRKTPCCVAFTSVKRLVGRVAISQRENNPENTIYDVKRFLGKTYEDATRQQKTRNWPYKLQNKDGKLGIQVHYKGDDRTLHPEEISAMILSRAVEIAEKRTGKDVKGAVITVPTSFNHAQRKATMDAANIAGIPVLGLINETTAAALIYAQQSMNEALKKTILMFHFGGGSFSAAVVNINGRKIEIKSAAGSSEIGGMEFDDILFQQSADEFRSSTKINMRTNPRAVCRLQVECEKVKNKLNLMDETEICRVKVDALCSGKDFESKSVNFYTLKTSAKRCLQILENAVDHAIRDAGVTCKEIEKVVLVGGASRLPLIPDVLMRECGFEKNKICKMPNIDEVPARGAAAFAAMLSEHEYLSDKDRFEIQDRLSYSLCVGEVDILQRNATIPAEVQTQCTQNEPTGKYRVLNKELIVVDRQSTEHEVGWMILEGEELHKSTICFCANINGMIDIAPASDGSQRIRCYMKCGLQEEEIKYLLKKAKKYAEDQMESDNVMNEVYKLEKKTADKIKKCKKLLAEINKISDPTRKDLLKWRQYYHEINDIQETKAVKHSPQSTKKRRLSETADASHVGRQWHGSPADRTPEFDEKSSGKTLQKQKDESEKVMEENKMLQQEVQQLKDANQQKTNRYWFVQKLADGFNAIMQLLSPRQIAQHSTISPTVQEEYSENQESAREWGMVASVEAMVTDSQQEEALQEQIKKMLEFSMKEIRRLQEKERQLKGKEEILKRTEAEKEKLEKHYENHLLTSKKQNSVIEEKKGEYIEKLKRRIEEEKQNNLKWRQKYKDEKLMLTQYQREKEDQMRKDHKEQEEEMEKTIQRLREKHEALKTEISNWQDEHKIASDTLQMKQHEIEQLKQNLDDTSQELEIQASGRKTLGEGYQEVLKAVNKKHQRIEELEEELRGKNKELKKLRTTEKERRSASTSSQERRWKDKNEIARRTKQVKRKIDHPNQMDVFQIEEHATSSQMGKRNKTQKRSGSTKTSILCTPDKPRSSRNSPASAKKQKTPNKKPWR